jgi:hypothetical protein
MNVRIRNIVFGLLKIVNHFYKKERKCILMIPHNNCKTDDYDIINYKSDNVLCLFNSIIRDKDFSDFKIIIAYYNESKLSQYKDYVSKLAPNVKISFVNANNRLDVIRAFMHTFLCVTAHVHFNFTFKTNKQKVICLGYYNPFKDDFISVNMISKRDYRRLNKMTEESFDFHMATSSICARITSIDLLLNYSKFGISGFPRNDIFYKDNSSIKEQINKITGLDSPRIICYTPTFRDYERLDLEIGDKSLRKDKTIFGSISTEEYNYLTSILQESNSLIVYKLHPWQEKTIIRDNDSKRIINYNYLNKELNISLYDVLAVTDLLITDYTSTVFDFLHRDKPIIFYFYDFYNYKVQRGFSYNPIESVCGGYISYNFKELMNALIDCISGNDNYKETRNIIHNIVNTHHDGRSCERVKSVIRDIYENNISSNDVWKHDYI